MGPQNFEVGKSQPKTEKERNQNNKPESCQVLAGNAKVSCFALFGRQMESQSASWPIIMEAKSG